MPHGKKKAGVGRRGEAGRQSGGGSEEDYDTGDTNSVTSALSDGAEAQEAATGVEEGKELDESSSQELFEDKLKDVIDATTEKSAKARTDALKSLCGALSKKYIPEFVFNRKMTISDSVERCLKKGKGEEQQLAARCAVLLLLQLGAGDDAEALFSQLRPTLAVIMADPAASPRARSACAEALSIGNFMGNEDIGSMVAAMTAFEKIFSGSYLKGDGNPRATTPDVLHLHAAALAAWALLLSICPTHVVDTFVKSHLYRMTELLESSDVEMRITSGETIALLYELAREQDEDFEGADIDDLCVLLKLLATDSSKYRAKKDRRQQRSSFRDILATVESGDWPRENIKFNSAESLHIDSWVQKKQYNAFTDVLNTGTNTHLTENELLREIFGLGAPIPIGLPNTFKSSSRQQRRMYNAAAFKARTKARGKVRDKRSAHVSGE